MTFDKYKGQYIDYYVFPDDGYEYKRIWNKDIGWHIVRGKKLPMPIDKKKKETK